MCTGTGIPVTIHNISYIAAEGWQRMSGQYTENSICWKRQPKQHNNNYADIECLPWHCAAPFDNVPLPITPDQWGFQSGKSTVSALLDVVHSRSEAIDQGKEICPVFFLSE